MQRNRHQGETPRGVTATRTRGHVKREVVETASKTIKRGRRTVP